MDSLLEAHGIMMKGLMADPGSLRQGPSGVIRENNIFHVKACNSGTSVTYLHRTWWKYLLKQPKIAFKMKAIESTQ